MLVLWVSHLDPNLRCPRPGEGKRAQQKEELRSWSECNGRIVIVGINDLPLPSEPNPFFASPSRLSKCRKFASCRRDSGGKAAPGASNETKI
ncbi:hypothetical protein MTP99_011398 [Tenebrio molitor]|jgi:hypothetical protein|nr:hypothetical protein MTP99_011398 [Tenebrio molitor]